MTTERPDLLVQGLSRTFSGPAGDLPVLRDVDLSMRRGDALVITGPSGSGKSTLLYILGLLDPPTSGTFEILGRHPWQESTADQARFRNEHLGFIFQDHHLLPQCSVLENVVLPGLAGSGITAETEQRARELLERVGLAGRIDHAPAQLSGGERQRVAVCRALLHRPALLLADEPTGNLDRKTAETIGSLLLELSVEHAAMLVCVTHSLELAERFPRRCELVDGRLVETSADPAPTRVD